MKNTVFKFQYSIYFLLIFLLSCANTQTVEQSSISPSDLKSEADRICEAISVDMRVQMQRETMLLGDMSAEKAGLIERKNKLGEKVGAIACECSADEALQKNNYKSFEDLKREVHNFSSECKYKGIKESGFIDLHRSNLIKACYFKQSTPGKILIASYGDLWLIKSQDYRIETLAKAYPEQAEMCQCFAESISKISDAELWNDRQIGIDSSVNNALRYCGSASFE